MRHIEVAAGLLWRGSLVLCCRRPEGRPQAGFWEFPGGKLKEGENAREALARELAEELGIETGSCLLRQTRHHVYQDINLSVTLHFFDITEFQGEPVSREGQTIAWVDCRKAADMAFLPADMELVAHLEPPSASAVSLQRS
ncbi:MAG: (deoxy)nucleoside triphosphate pyrophosphohydrolase [Desulfovibrionaceae bacterium]|nr:(deoxy)nucleoside triphosphate pyrophosphohydrolase [Desulfovibrionaceae bacterium]